MFVVLLVTVPIALFLVWAVVVDVRRRRAHWSDTGHDASKAARLTRVDGERKGSEWGGGV